MQTHFAGDVCQDATATGDLDSEHGVKQQLDDGALYLNCVFARHVRISGSSFVIRTVCSKWADGRPSAVHTVQPSSSNRTSEVPMLIIGSMASVMPAFNFGPLPRLAELGICGSSCILFPTPCPTNSRTTEKPERR